MNTIYFSQCPVNRQVFYRSVYCYLLVNLRPLTPGHVMLVPYRVVPRLKDLTVEESRDYFESLQKIHRFIEHVYKADALNISIQDGKLLGQSMPHLHTHIIPRYFTDSKGDDVYLEIDQQERELPGKLKEQSRLFQPPKDEDRKDRTVDEMETEAKWLSGELEKYLLV